MGLDDFMDLDVEAEETSESEESSSSESKLLKYDNWVKDDNGDPKRRGPYGYEDRDEYEDTIVGQLEVHGDLFKYNLPIFPHIEITDKYNRGDRYNHESEFTTMSCVAYNCIELRKVNREMIMLDTGHSEKEECLSILSERFDQEVTPETEVHLYFFAKMRHVAKMGMAGEFVDDWSLNDKDRVLKAVYDEAYTQRFREKDTGEHDLKHLDELKQW